MEIRKFEELGLSDRVLEAIADRGYVTPTPIQWEAIPIGIKGHDFIGQSQTGTGKTMAFTIPIIEQIERNEKKIRALVLCPTRELAMQVSSEINLLCKKLGVKSIPVYGGEGIEKQIRELKKGAQIVVGTPGRILDHIRRRTIQLDGVRFAVLDEADEMLDMGFVEDIEDILAMTDENRQTMLFSATLPDEIRELSKKYLRDPKLIKIKNRTVTVERIEQYYIKVRNVDKPEVLSRLIKLEKAKKTMVFCNTKKMVDELSIEMQNRGYSVEGLHGDLKQQKRDMVMSQFKRGYIDILIATDVAARGLDIDDVDVVFNYDLPLDEEQYVHRIGRTGRAGKTGKSYSFVFGREMNRLKDIERYAKITVEERKIPRYKDIQDIVIADYIAEVNSRNVTPDMDIYFNIIKHIKTFMNVETFLALVLKENLQLLEKENISFEDYDKKSRQAKDVDPDRHRKAKRRQPEKGMIRFHLNVGKNHRIKVADLVGAIAGECNIKGKSIGSIDIYDKYSFFEIPEKYEHAVIKNMKNVKIRGRSVTAQRSK